MQARKISLWLSSLLVFTLPVARISTEDFVRRCLIGDGAMADMSVMGNPERVWGQVSPLMFRSGAVIEPVEGRMPGGADKIVLVDCFYNNEWRKDKEGRSVRYHYVWDDTTNSGFSQLGRIISKLGAAVDTLPEAPTMQSLSGASIYIIVDPDTPLETEHPHFIDARAIDAVVKWVRQGGVLLLMGNDKGNAEFEHFNELAAQFGIRFNEDSRNRVTGKDYDVGKFDSFPDHPIFKGVKQIFIKELSTLSVQEPATVIYSDRADAIMAFARPGNGVVFAVGDPWLYNEYMDHRRLPEGYENDKAAENLFRWLLENAAPVRAH